MDAIKTRNVHSIQRLPGITEEIALALYDAGYINKQKVLEASENDLKKVAGMTTAKLAALKVKRDKVKLDSKADHFKK